MKSELSSTPIAAAEPAPYPMLKLFGGIGVDQWWVVLFTAPKTGVVVARAFDAPWGLGHFSTGWSERITEPFTGSVTLSN